MALIRCTNPPGVELQICKLVDDGTGTGVSYNWPDPAQRIVLQFGENDVPDEFWDKWCAQYRDELRPNLMLMLGVTRLDHGQKPLPPHPESN